MRKRRSRASQEIKKKGSSPSDLEKEKTVIPRKDSEKQSKFKRRNSKKISPKKTKLVNTSPKTKVKIQSEKENEEFGLSTSEDETNSFKERETLIEKVRALEVDKKEE